MSDPTEAPAERHGERSMTKAEFERYCNEHVKLSGNDGWGSGSGPRTRGWGTWVRNADRDYFDEMYRQYLNDGKLPS